MADNLFRRYAAAQEKLNQSGGVRRGAATLRQYENTTRQNERKEEEARSRRLAAAEAWTTRYNNGLETLPQEDAETARQRRFAAHRYDTIRNAENNAWRTGEDNSIALTADAESRRRMAARTDNPAQKPERKDFETPTNRTAFDRLALSDEAQKGGKPSEIQYRLKQAGLHGAADSDALKQAKAIQYMQEWDGKDYETLKAAYDESEAAYRSAREESRRAQKNRETENKGVGNSLTLTKAANLGQSGADAYDRQHENEKFHLDLLKAYLADRYKAQESPEAQAKNRIESEVTRAPDFAANKTPKALEGDAPKLFTKDRETYETARRISKMLADPTGTDAKQLSMDETLGKVNFMEPSERDVASYLLNTRGYKAMVDYFNSLKPLLDDRAAEDQQQRMEAFANKHETLATAASIALSPLAGLAGAADLATQGVKKAFTGQPIDFNTPSQRNSATPETLSGTVAEKINRKYGSGWSFLYQTGVSTANSLLASYAGGPALGASILATGAGASAARDIAARGGSDEQALAGGLLAGVFEGLFEKYSLSEVKALRATGRSTLRGIVSDIAKSALTNAQEEAATELANAVTDYLLMGDLSKLSQKVETYKTSGGMSAKEASKQAILDTIGEIVLAGAGGALSGAAMTGFGAAVNAVQDAKTGRRIQSNPANTIVEQALLMDERAESYQLAKELSAKPTAPTATELGNLLRLMKTDGANGFTLDPEKLRASQNTETAQPAAATPAQQPSPASAQTSKVTEALKTMKSGQTLSNSQAESILSSPEAIQFLRDSGASFDLSDKTKAEQRASIKAIAQQPQFTGSPNAVPDIQAALSPSYEWRGNPQKSGEGQSRSLSDLRKFVENKLRLTVAEKEMFMNSAIGEFMVKSENVHVRQTNDLPVLAHEAGHAMDKRFSLLRNADDVVRAELENNLSPIMKSAYPANLYASEGLAEFFRETMLDTDAAAQTYPAMTQYLQTTVDARTWQTLQEVFQETNRYFGSDALTRYSLAFNPTKTETSKLEALRSYETYNKAKEWWLTHFTDDLYGAKKVADLTGSRDIEFAVRATRNAPSQAAQCILQGVTDIDGRRTGGSLVEAMQAGNLNFDDQAHRSALNTYLGIQHALEDQARGVQIFGDPTLASARTMQSALASLEAQYPGIQNAAEATVNFVKDVRDTWLVGTGLISNQQAAVWDKESPNYVPMNRYFENDTRVSGKKKGKSGDDQVVHRQTGSTRDVNPILDNIISFTNNAVQAGRLNLARIMIFQSINQTEGLGWLADLAPKQTKVETLKTDQAAAQLTRDTIAEVASRGYTIDDAEIEDILQAVLPSVLTRTTKVNRKGGDYVSYFIDGEEITYHVHDKALFTALEAMKPETIGPVARFIGRMNRKFTTFVTTLNPAFNIASNPARDFQTAMMSQDSMADFGRLVAEVVRNTRPFWSEVFSGNGGDPALRQYFALGGWGEGVSGNTDAVYDSRSDSAAMQKFKQAKRTVGQTWAGFSGGIEQYLRAATFSNCLKSGMSSEEAMFHATNITTDFSRGGIWSKKINRVVPFFNAGLQGLTKEYRYLTGLDRKTGDSRVKTAAKRLTHFALTSIVLGSLEALAGTGFDPEDKEAAEAYKRLSTYQKNNSYCIYIGNGKFFTVRKPRELGILTSLTARSPPAS